MANTGHCVFSDLRGLLAITQNSATYLGYFLFWYAREPRGKRYNQITICMAWTNLNNTVT